MDQELDYEAIAKRASAKARREADSLYPPDMTQERQSAYEKAYIRYYREMTGVPRVTVR